LPRWLSGVDSYVAFVTDDERFSSPGDHDFLPDGFFSSPLSPQICQLADMMDLTLLC
jgi:hypothetical protein